MNKHNYTLNVALFVGLWLLSLEYFLEYATISLFGINSLYTLITGHFLSLCSKGNISLMLSLNYLIVLDVAQPLTSIHFLDGKLAHPPRDVNFMIHGDS